MITAPQIKMNYKIDTGRTKLIPDPIKEDSTDWDFWRILGNIAIGIGSLIAAPLTGGASLLADTALLGADIALNVGIDLASTGKVDPFSIALPIVGGGLALAGSGIGLLRTTQAKNIFQKAVTGASYTPNEVKAIKSSIEEVVGNRISVAELKENLVRAGLTEQEVVKQINLTRDILKAEGVNAKRFYSEVEFINQETEIFSKLGNRLKGLRIDINDIFGVLSATGIDVVGVRTEKALIDVIRKTPAAYKSLLQRDLTFELFSLLEADIEPTFWTQLLNAKKIERSVVKANELIGFLTPRKIVDKLLDKALSPIQSKVDAAIWNPLKKKLIRKIKQVLRQDIGQQKLARRNGVYPAFASGWINYLRWVKTTPGNPEGYCFVVFRPKNGKKYQPTLISELLTKDYVLQWSQSTSPGMIYNEFRKKYGNQKGVKMSLDNFSQEWTTVFNLVGLIPNKYLNLGVSLAGNIQSAIHVFQNNLWHDFFVDAPKYLEEKLIGKAERIVGGKYGVAAFREITGHSGSVVKQFQHSILHGLEHHQSTRMKRMKQGRNKANSLRRAAKRIQSF